MHSVHTEQHASTRVAAQVLRAQLEEVLPEDAHMRCTHTAFIGITRVAPTIRSKVSSRCCEGPSAGAGQRPVRTTSHH